MYSPAMLQALNQNMLLDQNQQRMNNWDVRNVPSAELYGRRQSQGVAQGLQGAMGQIGGIIQGNADRLSQYNLMNALYGQSQQNAARRQQDTLAREKQDQEAKLAQINALTQGMASLFNNGQFTGAGIGTPGYRATDMQGRPVARAGGPPVKPPTSFVPGGAPQHADYSIRNNMMA